MDDYLLVEMTVACPRCDGEVRLEHGLDPDEALWMHDFDCVAFVAELALTA